MNTKKFALAALCLVFLASGIISASDKSVYKTKPGGTYQASQVKRRIKEINRLKTELKTAKKIDDVGNLIKKVNKLANELKTNYNSEKKAIETFDTFVNNSVELVPEKLKIKATTNAFYLFTLKTRALRPQIRNFGKKEDIKQLKIAMKNIKKLKIIIDEELNKNVLKKIIEQRKLIAKKDVKWDKDEFEKDWQEKKDEDVDQFIIAKTDISKIEISKKNEIKT
ncbi:hypothetical protein KAH94_00505, partial [bacterium]|nr:hypothetical protein [bacterium]